ncbi:twin-arginine translocation signal domain-containing protein [Faecalibacterium prausnitzii]|uniref:twin-arginine translocation signal domain-containing protein n=1 Tax=Faecalibacterium prausnitzii TaxID=853 RepID=UPI0022E4764D|nr:twin-arginine translocation signal domain-containing protein [Faecalibacterium prausnitzii]
MKELNRREFLTLSGASVALLALAACGSTPPAPAVPTTGEEAKVLEAINKYRAAAGVKEPLILENGLKPAAELVVKIAKGEMAFDEKAAEAFDKAAAGYIDVGAPIGIAFDKDTGNTMPVCVYTETVDLLVNNLSMLDETDQANLKSASLIAIQLFEYGGVKYWVAVAAKGKVKP